MNKTDRRRVERLKSTFAGPHRYNGGARPHMTGADRYAAMERIAATLRLDPRWIEAERGRSVRRVIE